ncbi:glycoside/pentoside/hexuronide:cation symporter, GPH family [Novosphingobium mathurense]|uniref:Glycoside/pentoside/hexuronide:cation symporter, GPH family n=2 Tax=Novosphingobium mathurense TaxID=428990 RepID=A0A1U6I1U9_9SPHN|nr:glycoside/pentoside/hexuronide:cation symporter, GPH family [Novosphingobium mathurense]
MTRNGSAGQGAKLSLVERISYGFGDFGYSLPYNAVGAFLLYYYTVVAKMPAGAVGTIFLTARLFDAAVDMGVGILVDKTRTRWGQARPYILFTALPYSLVFVMIFMVPDWGEYGKLAWAFVTFNLLGILMSFGSIPYTAMLPMITPDTDDRLKLSSMRSIGTSVSVILGTAATMPLVSLFGGGDEHKGFLYVALLFSALSLIALLSLFRNCRERHQSTTTADFPILPAIRDMLRNQAWWVAFVFTLLYFVRFGAMISVTAFFAIDVLKKPWMISVMLPAISGMLLLSAFIAPPILSRTGIRSGCVGALLVSVGLFSLLPWLESAPLAFLAVYFAASITTSLTITAIFTMIAEAVDFHEKLFGVRYEGLLSAGVSLATKIGMAVGSAAIAYCLAWANYVPEAVTEEARSVIRWSYYGWPIVLLTLQLICILFWPIGRTSKSRGETTEYEELDCVSAQP